MGRTYPSCGGKMPALRTELLELLVRIKNGIENGGLPLTDIYARL